MKTIVVTGANSGVGNHVCSELVKEGYQVIGLSRKKDNLTKLIPYQNFNFYEVDLRDYQQVEAVFDEIKDHFDNIDVLVNSAAYFHTATFASQPIAIMDKMIDTNLKGVIYCIKNVLDLMLKNRSGKIINISSVSGCYGIENQAIYSATKHALRGLGESLNKENISGGVQTITLCPGGINTQLWNDKNPYKGDISRLLTPTDVVRIIKFIIETPSRIVIKNMTFFPNNEIH